MRLVIDANILFSALIKNSVAAKALFNEALELYAPKFVVEEFLKYKGLILNKTSRTKEGFTKIMHMLQDIIEVVPQEDYSGFMGQSGEISPDEKDVMYFSLALKLNCAIWSNDAKLKNQDKVKIYSTSEIISLI